MILNVRSVRLYSTTLPYRRDFSGLGARFIALPVLKLAPHHNLFRLWSISCHFMLANNNNVTVLCAVYKAVLDIIRYMVFRTVVFFFAKFFVV